jgi:alpha-beta hydrolase superfamily lysophospholipase
MVDQAFRFTSDADGMTLQGYCWRGGATPRGALVIAHGAAEHALRYERFARALVQAGYAVYALDHRGHGASQGPAGLGDFGAGGWDALVADLAQLIARVAFELPGIPVVLFGHSMGSFAAQQYCVSCDPAIAALVLSGSTAIGGIEPAREGQPPPARWQPNAAFEPARTPYDWLSRDPAEVDRYIADPLCGFEAAGERRRNMRPQSTHWFTDPAVLARLPKELPVLLLAGDADPINRKLAGLRLLEQRWREAGVQRIDTLYYEDGRHEMLNETNRDQVTADVIAWLTGLL